MNLPPLVTSLLVASCSCYALTAVAGSPPSIDREFRAAWIATVDNIDWPSRPGLTPAEQREELVNLLETAVELRMNAVVLQVRPACDALYRSKWEPWSEYLTGEAGKAPADGYDPLKFAVAEAHRRGIELHAWFNPYRALHPSGKSPLPANHISKTHPNIVKHYGNYLWLDPGEPGAEEHSRNVILDVVRRYDIDAVHFDDYFYPYPIADDQGVEVPFPDDESWAKYIARTPAGEQLAREDFRRDSVNRLLKKLSVEIKQIKPWVRFGVSPFGIYRPGQPEGIAGFDAYAKLYADSRLWWTEGIVDYMSPQLYWPIDQQAQSFPVLLKWWQQNNAKQRHLWPGLYTSKVLRNNKGWPPTEIGNQIEIIRNHDDAPGHVHFSIKAIAQDRSGLKEYLRDAVYQSPALPPATTWCELPEQEEVQPTVRAARRRRSDVGRVQHRPECTPVALGGAKRATRSVVDASCTRRRRWLHNCRSRRCGQPNCGSAGRPTESAW